MRIVIPLRRALVLALPLAAAACAAPHAPAPSYTFLRCGQAPEQSVAVAVATPAGESLGVRGHAFRLPEGALGERQRFKMYDRRSENVGVDIRPHGYRFQAPATITLSYARCGALPPGYRPFIVEVRPGTTIPVGEPLESRVDYEARTVTAEIEHLSGYLIAGT